MRTMKRILVAGAMAAALLMTPMAFTITADGTGPAVGLTTTVPTAHAERITSGRTGNLSLDDLCRQAADLINNAIYERDMADLRGDHAGAQEWHDLAIDMTGRAKGWGCNFSAALVTDATGGRPRTASSGRRTSSP